VSHRVQPPLPACLGEVRIAHGRAARGMHDACAFLTQPARGRIGPASACRRMQPCVSLLGWQLAVWHETLAINGPQWCCCCRRISACRYVCSASMQRNQSLVASRACYCTMDQPIAGVLFFQHIVRVLVMMTLQCFHS
jgi:hypothetical protein